MGQDGENPEKTAHPAGWRIGEWRVWAWRIWLPLLLSLAGGGLGCLIFALVSAGEIYDYQDTVDGVHLPRVDAVVVLAGGRGRIAAAGDIWYRYWELSQTPLKSAGRNPLPLKPPIFYISGMGHQSNWNVLAHQVRRGVLEALRPSNVIIERESENTEGNAEWLAQYSQDRHWDRILLITSRYHMKRARFIFGRLLAAAPHPVGVETLSVYQEPFEPDEWRGSLHGARVTMLEYMKWLYYQSFWKPPAAKVMNREF